MKLTQRLFYYLGGFAIGLILLFFFLGGKKASCDYGPTARVLKNIRSKQRFFSEESLGKMREYEIDTADISYILQKGNVDFSKSCFICCVALCPCPFGFQERARMA